MTSPARTLPNSLSRAPWRRGTSSSAPASGHAAKTSTWREDLGAGLVVFLVALPLCLGISLASGAPMASGLITGVIGGLVVSRLSGSQLMVSGPAAGLTAIVLAAITELGSFPAFLTAVVLGAVLQLLLGVARAGVIGRFFPSSVIRGMLTGIGLILIIKQMPYAFGIDAAVAKNGGGAMLSGVLPAAATLTLVSLALLAYWPKVMPERWRRMLPAPLAVVLVCSVGAWWLQGFSADLALPARAMVSLPVPQTLSDLGSYFSLPDWLALSNPAVYKIAITLAIVASLESLLSLEATDRLDPLKRTSSPHRELMAQGAGNLMSGLIGGLPMTGVIVRSAANVDAGGRTWRSSFIHGVLLVLAVTSVPLLLNQIPLAALAAVLIHTGFKLAHPKQAVDAWKRGPRYALPFFATVIAILATDLLVGIAVGLAIGIVFLLIDASRHAFSIERRDAEGGTQISMKLADQVTFLNKARIEAALQSLPVGAQVTVDASGSKHLDGDVVELLHEQRESARRRGIELILKGVPGALPALAH